MARICLSFVALLTIYALLRCVCVPAWSAMTRVMRRFRVIGLITIDNILFGKHKEKTCAH